MPHLLHKRVAETIFDIAKKHSFDVIVDKDCKFSTYQGINQQLPFYLSYRPARESAVSKVDVILIKNDKVKLVCEIEESGFSPTKIFGKLFSTAFAKTCRLKDKTKHNFYALDDNSFFIQVISTANFKTRSLKEKQGQLIENEIYQKLSLYNSWIKNYRLIYGKIADFEKSGKGGYDEIERIIQSL